MNATPTHAESPDDLDRLFSDFFKAQLKQPWPNAPLPPAAQPAEPAARVSARRDSSARARVTLAASVALMLGTCWYLSNGFQPGPRPAGKPAPGGPSLFDGSDAHNKGVLPQIEKNKALDNGGPKVDMGKLE